FVHWDFDPERKAELDKRTKSYMKAGLKRSTEDNIPTGYYFRWVVELYSSKGLFLHCVAESNYLELGMTPISTEKIWRFMNNSHDEFLENFDARMSIIQFDYIPVFTLKMDHARLLYEEFLGG